MNLQSQRPGSSGRTQKKKTSDVENTRSSSTPPLPSKILNGTPTQPQRSLSLIPKKAMMMKQSGLKSPAARSKAKTPLKPTPKRPAPPIRKASLFFGGRSEKHHSSPGARLGLPPAAARPGENGSFTEEWPDQVSFSLGCSHAGRCDTFVRATQLSCGTRCRPLMPGWLHGGRLSWDGDSVVARLAALMPPCPLVCSTMHKVQPDLPHCNRNLHTCPLLSLRQFSC